MLRSENVSPFIAAKFYKAIVQAVLLYGRKTWVLSPMALACLEGFHLRAAYRMAKRNKPRSGLVRHQWIYPELADVLEECGMQTIAEYTDVQRQTITVYVVTCPIFAECMQGKRRWGALPRC